MSCKSVGNMLKLFCVVLCCVGPGLAEIETKMDQLSKHLLKEMDDVWEMAVVSYSEPVINTTYKASVEFDMRAMGPLYNSTHMVIDVIAKKQAYPEGIVSVSDGHLEIAPLSEEWRPLLSHYAGPAAFLVVALLLAIVLPLTGLFWCCCFWCRVGRRRRPFDRKYDACLKGILAIILICLLTLFLFGVVCLFATDSQVESGLEEAPESLRVGIRDVREFLNATQAHARWLLVVNYRELEEKLRVVLTSSGMVISMKLGEFSRAVSVTSLNKLVMKLDDVQADLRTVKQLTTNLRINADQLNSGLRKVKNQLLQTLARCDQPKCIALQNKYKIGQLDTEIHYSQMPDVSDLLNNVTSLLNSNIKEEVGAGQQVFRDIQLGIQRSVQKHIPTVQAALRTTGERLEEVANEITWLSGNVSETVGAETVYADEIQRGYLRYGPYRRYVGLGAAIAPLLICCLMTWGLVCGVCGKRPDVYGASDCCNKGAGSLCMISGIAVIFLVGGALSLVVAAYFVVGVGSQRFFCDPLTEPRGNRLFNDLDKFTDLEKAIFNERTESGFNLSSVLIDWHSNQTLYKSLQLHRLYNLEAFRTEISGEISSRVASLRPAFPHSGATILKGSAKEKLTQLAATGLSDFDFDKILHALETNMTSLALDSLARQLNSTAHSLGAPAYSAERAGLLHAAAALSDLLRTTLRPMQRHTADLNETALRLRDELRFNHTSLKSAIEYLMHEATEAEAFLNKQGPERLQNMTREFASVIEVRLNEYLDRVVWAARHQVGRCAPVSGAFNATRDAVCNKILMPTNGFWMALAWCVILFLPILIVSQRLARLYLHLDPYPGPLVEAEYLYDAYADRDNVPLANAYKAEKRTGRSGRGRESEAGGRGPGGAGAGGGGGAARGERPAGAGEALPAPLDAHHARRYNDMAPKHWEEGPPRYHGPTEYERPPPYYYPGPTDRQ